MIVTKSAFSLIKLGRGYAKIKEDSIHLGNAIFLWYKGHILKYTLQITEIGLNEYNLVSVFS
ncbi:hypothetical protein D3C79_1055280 [compost metagenome]